MDPLSIVASAITLVEATSVITKSLYGLIKSLQTADSRLSTLHNDLQTLTRFLNSITRTLNGCTNSPLALAAVDEDMWLQCRVALEDCKHTLDDIGALVQAVDASSRSGGFLRRAKLAMNLSLHDRDLTVFKDKLYKSNWALQTVLGVLNVSLSLRNSASQDLILAELDRLKSSIDHALRAATTANEDGFMPLQTDANVTQNLRNLVRAARQFHTTASTTATTIQDTQERATWALRSDAPLSLAGDLPPFRRQRVEHFIEHNQAPSRRSTLRLGDDPANQMRDFVGTEGFLAHDDDDDDEKDEEEHELLFLQGLEELAKENIIHHDFAKAEVALEQAFQRHTGSASMTGLFQNLQLQLTICYFLQHKWQLAEPLVQAMSKTRPDITIFNLFHAIALAYLSEFSFEPALKLCKLALHNKKRLVGDSHIEYQETLGLLTTIYDIKGEPIWAEVFRRKIPADFVYTHPPSEVDFICRHPNLLRSVFGDNFPFAWVPLPGSSSPVGLEHNTLGPDDDSSSYDYTMLSPPVSPIHLVRARPTIRHRVNASAKRDLDTQKEVIFMIPDTPTSPSVQLTCPESAELTGVDQGALSDDETQARSLTKKLNRMLGTIRVRRGRSHGAITEFRESGMLGPQGAAPSKATSMFDLRRRAKAMRGKAPAAETVYLNHFLDDSRLPNSHLVEAKYPVELMDTSVVSGRISEDPAPQRSAQGDEASGSGTDDARRRSSLGLAYSPDGSQDDIRGVHSQLSNVASSVVFTPRPISTIFDDSHMIHKQDTQFPVSELHRDVPLHSAFEMQEEASSSTALQTLLERFEKLVESDPSNAADYNSQYEEGREIPSHITQNQNAIDWREDAIRSDDQACCDQQLDNQSSERDYQQSFRLPPMATETSDNGAEPESLNNISETAGSFVRGAIEKEAQGKDSSSTPTISISEIYRDEESGAVTPAGSSSPDLRHVRSETGSGSLRSTNSWSNPRTSTIASVFTPLGTPSTAYSTLYEFESDNGYDTDVLGLEDTHYHSMSNANRQDWHTCNFEDNSHNYNTVNPDCAAGGICHYLPSTGESEENSMDPRPRDADIPSRHKSTSSIQSESLFLVRRNTDSESKCSADDVRDVLPKKVDEPAPRLGEFDWVRGKDAQPIKPELGGQSWMDDDFWA